MDHLQLHARLETVRCPGLINASCLVQHGSSSFKPTKNNSKKVLSHPAPGGVLNEVWFVRVGVKTYRTVDWQEQGSAALPYNIL